MRVRTSCCTYLFEEIIYEGSYVKYALKHFKLLFVAIRVTLLYYTQG